MFVWQLAHDSMQVKRNIARRGVKLDTLCPMCSRMDEDPCHLFFKCKKVKQCWRALQLERERERLSLLQECSAKGVLRKIWSLGRSSQQKIILLMWCWWSARNKSNVG